jgi:hypothetical protein
VPVTSPKFYPFLIIVLLGLTGAYLHGDEGQDAERILQSNLQGKIFTLKISACGDRLQFKSDGTLVNRQGSGPWTVCANIQVRKIEIRGPVLDILGNRIFMEYDEKLGRLKGARASKVSFVLFFWRKTKSSRTECLHIGENFLKRELTPRLSSERKMRTKQRQKGLPNHSNTTPLQR